MAGQTSRDDGGARAVPDAGAGRAGGRRSRGLAREARIVLLSADPAADDELKAAFAEGSEALDLDSLLRLALHERAEVVLRRRLAGLPVQPDPDFMELLRRHALISSFRQRYLETRLGAALALLEAEGMQPLLLKGAALGVAAYDTFADRPMGDVDLLLPPAQAAAAHALLRRAGWLSTGRNDDARFYDGHHHLAPLYDPRYPDAVLEVHRNLLPARSPFDVAEAGVWARARGVTWQKRSVLVPAPEHSLLHLCIHYAWAHMAYLGTWRTFSDLHVLVRSPIDWAEFVAAAHDARAATCCYWTLRLGHRYGGVPVHSDVLRTLRPRVGAARLEIIERHLAANLLPGPGTCPSVRLLRWMWEAAIRPAASGHGAVRPWDAEPRRARPAPGRWDRLRAQFRRFGAWGRYLGTVATG